MAKRTENGGGLIEQVFAWGVIIPAALLAGGLGFTLTEGNPILTLLSAAAGAGAGAMVLQSNSQGN